MLPVTMDSLNNSFFGELGRSITGIPSVYRSPSGALRASAGGSFDVSPTANRIAHWFGLDSPADANPDSVVAALINGVMYGQKDSMQSSSATAVNRTPVQPQTIDYLNAELAKHYGMSAETAYQEALSNTSYQRAMKDMQAAGLNPAAMFASGNGSTANGVSYVSRRGSSGSSSTTARANDKALFSEGAYYGLSAAIGLVGALLMKSPTGYWIGNSAAQGALGAANAFYKSRN